MWSIIEHVKSAHRLSHITLPLLVKDNVSASIEFPPKTSVLGELWEDPNQGSVLFNFSILALY